MTFGVMEQVYFDVKQGAWLQQFADIWVPLLVDAGFLIKLKDDETIRKQNFRVSWKGHRFLELYEDLQEARAESNKSAKKADIVKTLDHELRSLV